MQAVITGGTSFIGAALTKNLLSRGEDCYVIARPGSAGARQLPGEDPHLHIIEADLRDVSRWESEIPHCDCFFHFGWGGVGAAGRADAAIQEDNVAMALSAVRAAARLGAKRFLFSGSQAEYGHPNRPTEETTPCDPETEYGKAKLRVLREAAPMARQLGMEYVHFRIFSVYGLHDHPWTLVSQCAEGFRQGRHVPLSSCEQLWNFVHVRDAAEAIRLMACCPLRDEDPVYNIAGEDTRPLRAFVEEIWQLAGRKGTPGWGDRQGALEKPYGIDPVIRKMQRACGWQSSVSFAQGIEEILRSE